jgi:hypothetical protein
MARVGCARVSTVDQDLEAQLAHLKAEGGERTFNPIREQLSTALLRLFGADAVISGEPLRRRHDRFQHDCSAGMACAIRTRD